MTSRRDAVEYKRFEQAKAILEANEIKKKFELDLAEAKAAWEEKEKEEA